MEDIYIVGCVRTAIGDFGGALKGFMPSDLGGMVVVEALKRAGVGASDVEHVVFGEVGATSGRDAYLARVCALNAGIPSEVPAFTLNRLCGSGVQAIVSAAQMMKLGEAAITVAGGNTDAVAAQRDSIRPAEYARRAQTGARRQCQRMKHGLVAIGIGGLQCQHQRAARAH